MTVLVTGTSSGIGLTIAKKYLSLSKPVIGISRRNSPLEQHPNYCHINADLACSHSLEEAMHALDTPATILRFIHAAGSNTLKPFVELSLQEVQYLIHLNFTSCLRLTQHILKSQPSVSPNQSCRFLAISSIWSSTGAPYRAIYGSTKASLDSLYRHLSIEYLNTNHRFMTIQLGFTDTPLTALSIKDKLLAPYLKRFLYSKPFDSSDVSSMIIDQIESPLFPATINMKIDSGLSCL